LLPGSGTALDGDDRLEYQIAPELQEKLNTLRGKWVAVTQSELLAFGDDPRHVLKEARRLTKETPILFRVPEEEGAFYFF